MYARTHTHKHVCGVCVCRTERTGVSNIYRYFVNPMTVSDLAKIFLQIFMPDVKRIRKHNTEHII